MLHLRARPPGRERRVAGRARCRELVLDVQGGRRGIGLGQCTHVAALALRGRASDDLVLHGRTGAPRRERLVAALACGGEVVGNVHRCWRGRRLGERLLVTLDAVGRCSEARVVELGTTVGMAPEAGRGLVRVIRDVRVLRVHEGHGVIVAARARELRLVVRVGVAVRALRVAMLGAGLDGEERVVCPGALRHHAPRVTGEARVGVVRVSGHPDVLGCEDRLRVLMAADARDLFWITGVAVTIAALGIPVRSAGIDGEETSSVIVSWHAAGRPGLVTA